MTKMYEVSVVKLIGCEGKNSRWERVGFAATKAKAEEIVKNFREKKEAIRGWWMEWSEGRDGHIEMKIEEVEVIN